MSTQNSDDQKESYFKNVSLEIHYVAGISKNKEILSIASENFNEEWITSDRVKQIYKIILKYYLEENVVMDYIGFAKIRDRDDTEHTLLLNIWKKVEYEKKHTTSASTITAKQTLQNLYNLRCAQDLSKYMVRKLRISAESKNYNTEDLINKFRKFDLHVATEGGADSTTLDTSYSDFKKRHVLAANDPTLNSGVLTGVRDLDLPMGGLRNGEFGIVLGPTASGKSIVLMNFAINCWLHFGDAIIVTIEMSKDDYLDRVYSNLSHIKFSRIRKEQLNDKEWKYLDNIQKTIENHSNKLHIVDMKKGCNMLTLKSNIDRIIQKHDVRGIFIDYLNIMSQEDNKVSLEWQQQVALAIKMKQQIARELHKPTWTLGQTTNDNNGAAFSSHIQDQVDVALQLKPDEETAQSGLLPARFVKTRNFRAAKVVLETNYQIMRCNLPRLTSLRVAEKLEEYDGRITVNKS